PAAEHALAAALGSPWRDLLYVPGLEFTSPLEPGLFRSALVVVPADGPAIRISSIVMPAFGIELCRLRIEALPDHRADMLGSFCEPERRGRIFVMSKERDALAARATDRAGWSYAGPSLGDRLGRVERVRLIRERVAAKLGGQAVGWTADRGLVIDVRDSEPCLVLASAESAEEALFLPVPRLYRALLTPTAAAPGATARDLLGYGEWPEALELALETVGVG
ncbi:MAG TPA: hypothetical protein VF948_04680, partial [Methylomirabilota bacterium]